MAYSDYKSIFEAMNQAQESFYKHNREQEYIKRAQRLRKEAQELRYGKNNDITELCRVTIKE